jgi:cyclophilin family peptidyl-prolyl cis-trans isomerase
MKQKKKKVKEVSNMTTAIIITNMGTITVKLFTDIATKTCANFIVLSKNRWYNNTLFHRVVDRFMIQGGRINNMISIYGKEFEDEIDTRFKFDKPFVVAMANHGPNTNSTQFFITTGATTWLNYKHTIFGEVINGQTIVKNISKVKTNKERPLNPVRIIKIVIKDGGDKSDIR